MRSATGPGLRRVEYEPWMMMSVLLALCALVLVAVFVLPLFGPTTALITGAALILTILVICYLLCVPRVSPASRDDTGRRQRREGTM